MTPETINAGGLPTAEPGNERPWFNSNAVTPPVTFIYLDDFIKNTPAISETAGIFQSGPASLEVVLHYWGWKEDNRDTLQATIEAANLMTYGIVKYVYSQTNLRALSRVGGDIGTLKHLLAAGFPVIVERGLQSGSDNETGGWIGNFVVINGYDDSQQRFTILSSSHKTGTYSDIYYGSFEQQWRAFNNLYLVVYQPDQEQMINDILGSQVDTRENYLRAAENASRDAYNSIYVRDQFFAWFNRGTNLTYLLNYREAAAAFDQAFSIYKKIPENELPWRLLWYQTSFYQAYFGSARYQDVIYLATMALNGPAFDQVEEGYYWRALAEVMLGQKTSALKDLEASVRANPKFSPSVARLEQLKGGGG
jgi:hypothetical protein